MCDIWPLECSAFYWSLPFTEFIKLIFKLSPPFMWKCVHGLEMPVTDFFTCFLIAVYDILFLKNHFGQRILLTDFLIPGKWDFFCLPSMRLRFNSLWTYWFFTSNFKYNYVYFSVNHYFHCILVCLTSSVELWNCTLLTPKYLVFQKNQSRPNQVHWRVHLKALIHLQLTKVTTMWWVMIFFLYVSCYLQ